MHGSYALCHRGPADGRAGRMRTSWCARQNARQPTQLRDCPPAGCLHFVQRKRHDASVVSLVSQASGVSGAAPKAVYARANCRSTVTASGCAAILHHNGWRATGCRSRDCQKSQRFSSRASSIRLIVRFVAMTIAVDRRHCSESPRRCLLMQSVPCEMQAAVAPRGCVWSGGSGQCTSAVHLLCAALRGAPCF